MFPNQYNYEQVKSNPGSDIKITYGSRLDKAGNVVLVEKGKDNIFKEIQAYKDSCDINLIIKKFEATGDVSLLNKKVGQFLDLTEMPKDYFEVVNTINDMKFEFDRLPVEVKEKFGNDADKFIGSIGTTQFYENLGFIDTDNNGEITPEEVKDQIEHDKKDEVKTDE